MATFNFDTLGNSLDNIQKMETELLSLSETFSRLNSGLNIDLTDINRFTTEFDKNKTQLLNGINPDDYNLISDKINEITSKALTEAVKKNDYNIFGTKGETINLFQQMVLEEIYHYFNNFTNVGNIASDLSSSLLNWRIGLYLLYQKLWQFPRAIASHILNETQGEIQSENGRINQIIDLTFDKNKLSRSPTTNDDITSNKDWKKYKTGKDSLSIISNIIENTPIDFLPSIIFNLINNNDIPVSSLESNMKGSNSNTDPEGNIYQIESLLMDKTISGIDKNGKLTSTDNKNTIFSNIKNSIESSINVFEENLIKRSDEILNTDFAFENKYNIVLEIPKHKITGTNGVSPEYVNPGYIADGGLLGLTVLPNPSKDVSNYKLIDNIHFVSSSIPSFSVDVIENRINNLRRKSGGNITGDTFSITFRDNAKREYYLMFQQWLNMMYWKDETKDNYTSASNNWGSVIKLHNYPEFYQGKISFILPKSNTMDMGTVGDDKPYGDKFINGNTDKTNITPQNSYHTGIIGTHTENKISGENPIKPSNFYEKYYLYVVTFENVFISGISDIRLESGSSEISTFDVTFDYTFPVKFNKWDGKSLTPFMDI